MPNQDRFERREPLSFGGGKAQLSQIARGLLASSFIFLWLTPSLSASTSPQFGLWYTVWWTKEDEFHHWANCHRFPARGKYSAGDPAVIAAHYAEFRDMGVDFLIMDDTNGAGNDNGLINRNIKAWFDFMDAKAAVERIPICLGSGGEMRDGGKTAQQVGINFYWENWAKRPSYFQLEGKPLVLLDTDKNYGPGDFQDERFTIRWAYNGGNHDAMFKNKTWGWGSYAPAPILEECMSIWPGHRFPGKVVNEGWDPLEAPRQGGQLYVGEWLRVLKASPKYVTVADWNNFEEETAMEDSYTWEDDKGRAATRLYTRITKAYSHLRWDELVKGEYYRDENKPEVWRFDGKQLVHQSAMPERAAVILVPERKLEKMGIKFVEASP